MHLAKKMERTRKRCPRSNAEQFLCREGQNRPLLGSWLSECNDPRMVRSVLMGCGDFYPCNAKLFQWKLRNSAACELCHGPCETSCHIQCVCPSLEHSRIQAHHSVWDTTVSQNSETPQERVHCSKRGQCELMASDRCAREISKYRQFLEEQSDEDQRRKWFW